jgi:tRNA pseudouridine38-40 synthase
VTVPDAPDDCDVATLRSKLNGMLGPEMSFASIREVPPDFHARFSARSRCYIYAVYDGEVPDPFLARTAWLHGGRLDVDLMNEAAGHLVGEHDFRSFGRVPTPEDSAVRTLHELRCTRDGDLIRIRTRANAFIRNMVRSVVGTLVEVGKGKKRADEMPSILSALDRNRAGVVAPPEGLCLVSVEYDEGWSRPFGQDA